MKDIKNNSPKIKRLILFSGGKDSFLTACDTVKNHYKAVLLSFNPGCIAGETNFAHGANRLIDVFGYESVEFAGVYNTASIIQRLNTKWIYSSQKELGEKYPNLTNCQFNCLHCQTAMFVAAISFAMAHNIVEIACGYRSEDMFCTGISSYYNAIKELGYRNGITIYRPLWDMKDSERDDEMIKYGFVPQVLEAKCLIGRKQESIDALEITDIVKYFLDELQPLLPKLIAHYTKIFRYTKLFIPTGDPIPGSLM